MRRLDSATRQGSLLAYLLLTAALVFGAVLTAQPLSLIGAVAAHYVQASSGTFATAVTADSPLRWWRFGEASGTTAVDSSGNGGDGTYVSGPTLGVTGLIAGDSDTAMQISSDTHANCPVPASTSNCAIEIWWEYTGSLTNDKILWRDNTSAGGTGWLISLAGTNIAYRVSGTDYSTSTPVSAVTDSNKHQFVVIATASTVSLVLDGAQINSSSRTGSTALNTQLVVGRNGTASGGTRYTTGIYDECIVFSSLTVARALAHWNAGH